MDHNLEDTMNLDVGMVDFVHSDETVVNQDDILTSSHDTEIPMEFQPIDEQQMLMETGGEEVIVPELMDHQFTLSTDTEYTVQDSQLIETSVASVNLDHTSLLTSHSDTLMDLQFESQSLLRPENIKLQPQVYTIKPANPVRAVASTPRPVAIAPKPYPKPSAKTIQYGNTKQFAIAPKPVTMMTKGAGGVTKKISLSSMVQGAKGGSVLAQIGKQLVMVPASSSQKIKLIAGSSGSSVQAQMISSKNIAGQINKQNVIKVQNSDLNQPAVLTKLSQKGTLSPPRFLMHPKISMANKVLMSPTKPIVSFGKPKQIVTIPNSPGKIMSTGQQGTLKKIVISGSTAQSMGLKAAIPQKPKPVIKAQGTIVKLTEEQKSQIHQMPGKKGVSAPSQMQYRIRLVSPSSTLAPKEQLQPQLAPQPQPQPAPQPQLRPAEPQPKTKTLVQVPSKTFLVTDGKGNIIEMTNKIPASQQSLIVSSGNSTVTKVMSKPKKTVLRLSSVGSTSLQSMPVVRSPQSLLAPVTPDVPVLAPSEKNKPVQQSLLAHAAVAKCETVEEVTELHVERQSSPYLDENTNSADNVSDAIQSDPPLIVVPSYTDQQEQAHSDQHALLDAGNFEDARITTTFLPERSPSASPRASRLDSDESAAPGDQQTYSENELDSRPRKACNCTKSQCLKLYCDCFANGEFCNRCNCNNCHNNLDNEELRQKAIRGCLDRNPNAFRPKIGKSKSTGPELIRRHNKGCNCKRSGCLKNYCECYEAKIACTAMCKCVGCRNVEESLERARRREPAERRVLRPSLVDSQPRPPPPQTLKQPCSFMTTEVIEAVCQCLLAAASEDNSERGPDKADPISDVIGEFARCLQDIISAPDGTRSRDDNIIP